MVIDSINDEVLRIKRELAAKCDNDLAQIVADAQSRERDAISLPPRRYKSEQSVPPESPATRVTDGQSNAATG
jgi:hypothetical protein